MTRNLVFGQPLRVQLFILVLATALPLVGLLAHSYYSEVTAEADKAKAAGLNLAEITAAETRSYLDDMEHFLKYLAQRPLVRALDPARCDPALRDFARLHPELTNLLIVNGAGAMVCSVLPLAGEPVSYADREWFQRTLRAKAFTVTGPILGRITKKWIASVAYPVSDESGKVSGVLGGAVDLARYQPLAGTATLRPGTVVRIVDGSGTIVAAVPDAPEWVGKNVRDAEIVQQVLREKHGQGAGAGPEGERLFYGFARIPRTDWIAYAALPAGEVFARINAIVRYNAAIGLVALLAVGMLAYLLGRSITVPMRRLVEAAGAVAAGHLDQRLPLSGAREIAAVAGEFNRMAKARQQAEQALAESETRARDMARASGDWFWATDAENRFTWMSDSVETIAGVPAAWHYGKRRDQIAAESQNLDAEPWQSHLEAVRRREAFRDFRYLRKGPKEEQWLLASGVPVFDAAGEFSGYRGVGSDITRQVQVEVLARHADERLKAAIEHLNEAVTLTDTEDRIVFANRRARELNAGVGSSFEPGRRYEEFLRAIVKAGDVPDAVGREESWLAQRLADRRNPVGPLEQRRQHGIWILVNDQRLPDGGTITFALDITARKQAAHELADSEATLRSFFDSAPMMMGVVELAAEDILHIVDNAATERFFGIPAGAMRNRLASALGAPQSVIDLWLRHYRAAERIGGPVQFEYTQEARGRSHWLKATVSPIAGDTRPPRFCYEVEDATERKKGEDSLKRLTGELKAVSIRLAQAQESERRSLAHELHDQIGQSLTALGLNLHIMRNFLPPDTAPKFEVRLKDALELVDTMVERIRAVLAELHPPMLDDYGVLATLRWHAERMSERTGLSIRVAGAEPAPRLPAPAETALFRIAQEALFNVTKHAGATEAAITLARQGEGIRLTIEDNGKGFRIDTGEPRKQPRGWGLLTMRERAASVGGTFRIESAAGTGTRLIVEIAGGGVTHDHHYSDRR